ncbi:MAG: tetratricopeptide repeat protein [Bacteroidaceae bacterium]|nr:tetratricopeptide repeat protein [Bacteroidaceae bacterium]
MKKYLHYILLILLIITLGGCASRKKNTAQTRMYHSFFARYNTFYNGNVAFKKGYDAQTKGHKDNFLEQLPLLIVSDKATKEIGKSDYDKAIEKSQKAIKNHSIKRKPRREAGKKLTEKKKRFYAQREFNPFLWRAWMMMADAYFQKGEFTEAAGTYIYISRLYENNPDVLAAARIGLAQCYAELDWLYEAEELLSRIKRDSMPASLGSTLAHANANMLIRQERYEEAIPHIEKAIKRKGIGATERGREYYLLGQIQQLLGNNEAAFKAYSKVIAQSPPYELEINARIRQTETMTGKEKRKIIRKLERMIRQDKNKEYLSQLYYALGNVHLSAKDTLQAVRAYETGLVKGGASGYGKGMLHLSLAHIYWEQQKFSKSGNNYKEALGIIKSEDEKLEEYKRRSEITGELAPHTDIIEKNSELLYWSRLSEKELTAEIEKKIEQAEFEKELQEYIEKEQRKAAKGSELENANTAANMNIMQSDLDIAKWYFYNPKLVSSGISNFKKSWGDRTLKDFWRLSQENITTAHNDTLASDSSAIDGIVADSLLNDSTAIAEEILPDTLSTDPTTREYWLQQIPRSEEKLKEMHTSLSNALFDAATIFEGKLGDKQLAMSHWERLVNEYPEYSRMADVYYHLFLCSSRWDAPEKAELYKNLLITQYPDSVNTKRIQEPDFFESTATKRHKEDSIYVETYASYTAADYDKAIENNRYAAQKYPNGAHRSRFMFIDALSKLYSGRQDEAIAALDTLLKAFPNDTVAGIATEIGTGIKEGRLLHSGISTSIWDRRLDGTIKGESDSVAQFSAERNEPYYFILAFPNDSLDEKRLLFEMARYNFSRYMVRNFTMEFNKQATITLLEVKEFLNFDEAFVYRKRLYGNSQMATLLDGITSMIISKSNLELLLNYYTFDDYTKFYEEQLLSIPEPEIDGYTLDEPLEEKPEESNRNSEDSDSKNKNDDNRSL